MKLTHEVVTAIGFKQGTPRHKSGEHFYSLDLTGGGIVMLTHTWIGSESTLHAWFLEDAEVETVADMLSAMYRIGGKAS